jgi:transmembrane sensor
MHDSIQIEEMAAAWLARRDGHAWSADDQVALTAWLEASTAHRVAYIRLDLAWRQALRLKALPLGDAPPAAKSAAVTRVAE